MPHGWMSKDEQEELATLAANREVLEIGGWQGLSTVTMGKVAKHVTTLDHFRGDEFTERVAGKKDWRNVLNAYIEAIEEARLSNVTPVIGDMHETLLRLDLSIFDFVLYDADHSPKSTEWALETLWIKWVRAVATEPISGRKERPVATLAVHDYKPNNELYKETNIVIRQWMLRHQLCMRVVGSLAIFEV